MIKTKDGAAAATVEPKPRSPAVRKAPPATSVVPETASVPASFPKRVILHMSLELRARIDAEWHRRRLPSRAETIRVLLEEGLKS